MVGELGKMRKGNRTPAGVDELEKLAAILVTERQPLSHLNVAFQENLSSQNLGVFAQTLARSFVDKELGAKD